jgi:hypothetical protein
MICARRLWFGKFPENTEIKKLFPEIFCKISESFRKFPETEKGIEKDPRTNIQESKGCADDKK